MKKGLRKHPKARGRMGLFLVFIFTILWVLPMFSATATTVGNSSPGGISGFLWADGNGMLATDWNGLYNIGEQPIAGYTVYLFAPEEPRWALAETQTGADGTYIFEGLEPGNYVLGLFSTILDGTEYLLPMSMTAENQFAIDWSSNPLAAYTSVIEVVEGQYVESINAGMRLPMGIKPLMTTTSTGILSKLGALNQDDSITINSEAWVVVKTHGSGNNKAVMLAKKGGSHMGRFGSNNTYNGSEIQTFCTSYYTNWTSPLKDLALVPTLGSNTSESVLTSPFSNPSISQMTLASTTKQTKDIVFVMSRGDMVEWNKGATTPVRTTIRKCFPQDTTSAHTMTRTAGTGTTTVWELNNRAQGQGWIANAASCTGNNVRVPSVWVKAGGVWRNVNVYCIDTKGNTINPPYSKSYQVPYDESITLAPSDIPTFANYHFNNEWKIGSPSAASNYSTPISVSSIKTDTNIYLVYGQTIIPNVTVTAQYIDKANGNSIGSPTSKTYSIPAGGTFTMPNPDIQDILGYDYKEWKVGLFGATNTSLPISIANVTSNTTIYLLYDKAAMSADEKNAYINGSTTPQNGLADSPNLVKKEDTIKYTITANNYKLPGTSSAKYDILFVLDWSRSMDALIVEANGGTPAKQYERDVMVDMFDFITSNYPNGRVAVMAMNSDPGLTNNNANTHIQFETDFLTPAEYWGGKRNEIIDAFDTPWKNPTEDLSTFLRAANQKMEGVLPSSISLYGDSTSTAGEAKYIIPRKPVDGENISERTPVVVLISDFQIPSNQSVSGSNYWSSVMQTQITRYDKQSKGGILQTVRLDHKGNHTGGNDVYHTAQYDNYMKKNVSPATDVFPPAGHPNWGFTKVDLNTPYTSALKKIKDDFIALAPPSDARGTIIIDMAPDGLEVDENSISHNGKYDPITHTIIWNLSNEDAGEITVDFTATVKQNSKLFENTAAIIFCDGNESKTNSTYHKTDQDMNVTITKAVSGASGSKTQKFKFEVYLLSLDWSKPLEGGKPFTVEGGVIDGSGATAPTYTSLTLGEEPKLTFYLSHGQTLTIKDVPSHIWISIVEEKESSYEVSFTDSKDGSTGDNVVSYRPVMTNDGTRTFDFVNKRILVVPTGIAGESLTLVMLPLFVMLAVPTCWGIVRFKRRRSLSKG